MSRETEAETEATNLLRSCAERRRQHNIPSQKAALVLSWSASKLEKIEADAIGGSGSFAHLLSVARQYDAWLTRELGSVYVPQFLRDDASSQR
jgi:hypothetical protein